jgi:diguanylate cyclase (GGDEF)-like protein
MVLVMFDIDHFKNINDRYGHAGGDKVLKEVSNVCKNRLRGIDLIGRLGGEEFGVMLPQTDLDGGQTVAECLRETIETQEIHFMGETIRLTSSFGVAVIGQNDTFERMTRRTDDLLYEAKNAGRNRVVAEKTRPNLRLMPKAG